MKNKNTILLVIAGLLLAILLALLLASREGGRYGKTPSAPAPAEAIPLPPEPAPVRVRVRALPAVAKPKEKQRKLRVSSLRDPGEAMGGGVRLDLPDKTTGQP
jgi:hypothetical protein